MKERAVRWLQSAGGIPGLMKKACRSPVWTRIPVRTALFFMPGPVGKIARSSPAAAACSAGVLLPRRYTRPWTDPGISSKRFITKASITAVTSAMNFYERAVARWPKGQTLAMIHTAILKFRKYTMSLHYSDYLQLE